MVINILNDVNLMWILCGNHYKLSQIDLSFDKNQIVDYFKVSFDYNLLFS